MGEKRESNFLGYLHFNMRFKPTCSWSCISLMGRAPSLGRAAGFLPGITMACGAAASVLTQRRPPLASLSHSRVMCFFSRLVSLGTLSWLLRFKACSLELFDRQVFKRWATAASTVSSQPCVQKPVWNLYTHGSRPVSKALTRSPGAELLIRLDSLLQGLRQLEELACGRCCVLYQE